MNMRNKFNPAHARLAIAYISKKLILSGGPSRTLTQRRDDALKALDDARTSDLYESIAANLNSAVLSNDEYLYYALVTDNVCTVDPDKLLTLPELKKLPFEIIRNLQILGAALRFSRAVTMGEKEKCHAHFGWELGQDMHAFNSIRPAYLNMAGIHLKGLNCFQLVKNYNHGIPRLCFTDLRGAKFDDCNFTHVSTRYCDMSDAVFTKVTNQSGPKTYGLDFENCIVRRTKFNDVNFGEASWRYSDFDSACFNHSSIVGNLSKCNFNDTKFCDSEIILELYVATEEANFTNADFSKAHLSKAAYTRNTFTNAMFLNIDNDAQLFAEIARVEAKFLDEFKYDGYAEYELEAFQKLIAANVERYISALNIPVEARAELMLKVMEARLFHYEYIEPVKALVAGLFQRPENTLLFFGKYINDESKRNLRHASENAYKVLYDYGITLLKKFNEVVRQPEKLEGYTQANLKQIHADAYLFALPLYLLDMPPEFRDLPFGALLEKLMSGLIEKRNLKQASPNLQDALATTIILLVISTLKAAEANHEIEHNKIVNELQSHPLVSLEYNHALNCLIPALPFNASCGGVFRSAAEFIKECTNEARLLPPVTKSTVCAVPSTLFDNASSTNLDVKVDNVSGLRL